MARRTARGSVPLLAVLVMAAIFAMVDVSVRPAAATVPPVQISTLAGAVQPGGGPAPAAAVSQRPMGLALFPTGSAPTVAFVADPQARVVRRIDLTTMTETVYAGTGETGPGGDGGSRAAARFVEPVGVAVDGSENLFVVDRGAHQVRRIDKATGLISTVIGVGSPGFAGDGGPGALALLNDPVGVAVDASGAVFVADRGNDRIRRLVGGTLATVAGGGVGGDGPASGARLVRPSGVTVSPVDGSIVFTEQGDLVVSGGNKVRRLVGSTLSTIAGTGSAGFSGDAGPATSARLRSPQGVTVAANGDVFIADTFNSRIRRVDVGTGLISTVAGTADAGFNGDGAAATTRLSAPWGLAAAGSAVYLSDLVNYRVRTFTVDGPLTTIAGPGTVSLSGPAALTQLAGPEGVALVGADVYVADTANCVVRRLTGGTATVVAGTVSSGQGVCGPTIGGTATTSLLDGPTALLAVGSDLYIADSDNHRVLRLSGGTLTVVAGSAAGFAGYGGDGGSASSALLNRPVGLARDSMGRLYIADSGNNRIRRIDGSTISTFVGTGVGGFSGDGGAAASATLRAPRGVAVDALDQVLVADTGNNRIRRVSGGNIVTFAGTGAAGSGGDGGVATAATLDQPAAVAAGPDGFVYVADTQNNRIRVVTGSGTIRLLAGRLTGGGFSGDGGRASVALLDAPYALVIGPDGDVTVADTGNDRVRRINSLSVPSAPGSAAAVAGSTSATVTFEPSADDGGLPVTGYVATASPGGATCTWAAGPDSGPPGCTVAGLTGGVPVTVSVVGVNEKGPSPPAVAATVTPAGAYRFHAVEPTRILDSRVGLGGFSTPWAPGQTRTVQVTNRGPVPASGVTAVVVNLTGTDTTGPGFAALFPGGSPRPVTSALNWVGGQTVANQAVVSVGPTGTVQLYNHVTSSASLVLDVVGWFDDGAGVAGQGFTSVSPSRILDSRINLGTSQGAWKALQTRNLTVTGGMVPTSGVSAVVLNLTVTSTTDSGYLSLFPAGSTPPATSSVNWASGQTVANQVTVPVGAGGAVSVYNYLGSTEVIADVVGYYTSVGGAGYHPVTPTRILDSRNGTGGYIAPWPSATSRFFQATATYGSGVPQPGTAAIVANATVTDTTTDGFLLLYPSGTARPNASNVNWAAGETRANLTTTKVGAEGGIMIYNHFAWTNVVVDVTGWYG